jgi:hypothetical protein
MKRFRRISLALTTIAALFVLAGAAAAKAITSAPTQGSALQKSTRARGPGEWIDNIDGSNFWDVRSSPFCATIIARISFVAEIYFV